ncbi:MAG: sensor histidine kinase [Clostridiales bacterium]|nr:sensor histidine kinase [Clostridiales bacterium]
MTSLWWYKLLFVTELIIAETAITFHFERRKLWGLRLPAALAVIYLFVIFFPLPEGVAYSGWYLSLMFMLIFAVTLCGVLFVFRITVANGVFCAITAYTIQHLSFEIYTIFSTAFSFGSRDDMYGNAMVDLSSFNSGLAVVILVYVDIFILIGGITYYLMRKYLRDNTKIKVNGTMLLYSALILLVDVVLNAFVVYIPEKHNAYEIIIGIFNVLCCLLVLYIQMSVVKRRDIEKEMEDMKATISQMHKQYVLRKESIDVINRKCHDLRYQMSRFAATGRVDMEEFRKIEEAINIYDSTVKTGNEVLDVILTEKTLLCRENGVQLTCMADCSRFNFIHEGELYALFGNLIDNAVEAALSIDEVEKRYIGLNIHAVGDIISIVIENYYNGEIELSGGLPKTSKGDENYHGYGLKSVDMIVKQYAGNLTITANDGIFRVTILIPIPKSTA